MSLSDQARFYMAKRDELSADETAVIDNVFDELYGSAMLAKIPAAKDDRAAELEAAIIKFIIESREG